MSKLKAVSVKPWMVFTLTLAGVYNLIWGAWVIFYPEQAFLLSNLEIPSYIMIWQALGMIIGVFGIAYLAASMKPFVHWPIIFVGLLTKMFSVIGFVYYANKGDIPYDSLYILITDDVVWLIPFAFILYYAYLYHRSVDERLNYFYGFDEDVDMSEVITNKGNNLLELSFEQPILLVFLRHFGCTFCRESLENIADEKSKIESKGTKIILVHMVEYDVSEKELSKYGLQDIELISDVNCELYENFGLEKGTFYQLFGLKVWVRAFYAGLLKGHFIGWLKGKGTQMPGVFLIKDGEIVKSYKHFTAADTPDYLHLSTLQNQ
jgi:peroxiredoxin